MRKTIFAILAAAAMATPALANDSKITKGYHTMDAMGAGPSLPRAVSFYGTYACRAR